MNSITFPYMYATYTMALYDFNILYPSAFNDLKLENDNLTTRFINTFNNYWCEYEINGDTPNLFILRVKNKFNSIKDYWTKKIIEYEKELDYNKGIEENYKEDNEDNESNEGTNNTSYVDLPNKVSNQEYITSKTLNNIKGSRNNNHTRNYSKSGGINVIDQRQKYLNYLNNIMVDFVKEFKDCFIQLYS